MFRYTKKTALREAVLITGALIFALPIYVLLALALKSPIDAAAHPLSLPTRATFSNFSTAWRGTLGVSLGRAMLNSLVITAGSVILLLTLGALAAYAIARHTSRLSNGIYLLFVSGLILPVQLGIIPLYIVMRHLHLLNSYYGMIVLYVGLLMPLTVFLYTGFIRTLPNEYEEAAQIDGASRLRIYVRVVFPLLRPITATVAILTGILVWNDFFNQLIFLGGSGKMTLTLALYAFASSNAQQWTVVFAAVVITIVPMLILYLLAQRHVVAGFSGGIRG